MDFKQHIKFYFKLQKSAKLAHNMLKSVYGNKMATGLSNLKVEMNQLKMSNGEDLEKMKTCKKW